MSRPGFYRVLENSFVYDFSQLIIAPGGRSALRKAYFKFAEPQPECVLVVGCGPCLRTPANGRIMVGVDINEHYLKQFEEQKSGPLFSAVAASASRLPFKDESFSECRTACVFHHLESELVVHAVREMYRVLKRDTGRLIILDMVYPRSAFTNPYAYFVCRYDRGEHARTEQAFKELLSSAVPEAWEFKPFRYSRNGLRGIVGCLRK